MASFPGVLLRVGLGAILTYFVGIAAFAALLFGSIVTTGCFLTCEQPNPLAGIPLLLLGSLLFAIGLGTLWWGLVDRYWRAAIKVLTVLCIGFAILLVGLGLFA